MLRAAGAVLVLSGAATMFLSVFMFVIMFIVAVIPFAVGVFQTLTGIRLLVRGAMTGPAPIIAAAIGLLVGALHLPGMMFNPGVEDTRDAWRLGLALVLLGANGAALWAIGTRSSN
jgi:hypothetical protein